MNQTEMQQLKDMLDRARVSYSVTGGCDVEVNGIVFIFHTNESLKDVAGSGHGGMEWDE